MFNSTSISRLQNLRLKNLKLDAVELNNSPAKTPSTHQEEAATNLATSTPSRQDATHEESATKSATSIPKEQDGIMDLTPYDAATKTTYMLPAVPLTCRSTPTSSYPSSAPLSTNPRSSTLGPPLAGRGRGTSRESLAIQELVFGLHACPSDGGAAPAPARRQSKQRTSCSHGLLLRDRV